jgi:ribosome-associated heat shock protein Hsp15
LSEEAAVQRQRVDAWLWAARFFRKRALAQAFLADGRVRMRGRVLDKGDFVKVGDVLTFVAGDKLRTIELLGLADRRGNSGTAKALWRDLYDPV